MSRKPEANLVIRPERLGDLVLATPVFRAFKETWPDIPLHVLTDNVYAAAIRHDPHVDKILEVRWKSRERTDRSSFPEILQQLRSSRYLSAAQLFSGCAGWNWVLAAAGVRKVAQLGGSWPAVLLRHQMVLRKMYSTERHYTDWYLDVAQRLGASTNDRLPKLYLTDDDRSRFLARFPEWRERKPRILIHPFDPGSAPNLGRAAYKKLIAEIARDPGLDIFITGSPGNAPSWERMERANIHENFLGNLSLRELMCACELADLVVAASTGVIHMAAALGTNTLGFYCPASGANPALWGPRGTGRNICLTPAPSFCKHLDATSSPCTGAASCDLSLGIDHEKILQAVTQLIKPAAAKDTQLP